jgi:S1-C subfamily serine protease
MRDGRVRRSRLGVVGQTVALDSRLAARLKRTVASAVLAAELQDGGAGQKGGLGKGDILLELDGERIASVDDLHRLLTADRAVRSVAAQVLRRGSLETVIVVPALED